MPASHELLQALTSGKFLAVYCEERAEWSATTAHRWLDDPLAVQFFQEFLQTYLGGIPEKTEISAKLAMMLKLINEA